MCVIPEIYLSQERREGSASVNCTKVDKERSCRKSLDQLTDPTDPTATTAAFDT